MGSDSERLERLRRDVRAFFIFFIGGTVVWIIVLAAASALNGGSFLFPLGALGMFSAAALISGCFLGFLFGIPRVLASGAAAAAAAAASKDRQIEPNTNLEQISDWLTKVLVGVGLTELGKISDGVKSLSASLNTSLTGLPAGGPVAVATIIALGSAGFLWIYFECRTSIFKLFDEEEGPSDKDLNAASDAGAIAGALTGAAPGAATGAVTGAVTGATPASGQTQGQG